MKQKHKDWLIKNNITSITSLVSKLEEMKTTVGLGILERQMLMDFCYYVVNEQSVLNSFFRENKKQYYPENLSFEQIKNNLLNDNKVKGSIRNIQKIILCDGFGDLNRVCEEIFNTKEVDLHVNQHIKFTILEENIMTDSEQEQISRNHMSTRHKASSSAFHLDEVLEEIENKEKKVLGQLEDKTDRAYKDTMYAKKLKDVEYKLGIKYSEDKLFYELDFKFIQQMAERMQSNKNNSKYELWNWMRPMTPKGLEDLKMAMWRHVIAVMQGELEDDGREFGHLEAISNNAMMINYQLKNNSK